jgi:hypothetical protein
MSFRDREAAVTLGKTLSALACAATSKKEAEPPKKPTCPWQIHLESLTAAYTSRFLGMFEAAYIRNGNGMSLA